VDGTRDFGADVTGKAIGSTEAGDQVFQPGLVDSVTRIEVLERPFKPQSGKYGRRPVARPDHVDHVQVMFAYEQVEMSVDQRQARHSSPMPQKSVLDVVKGQVPFEEDVVVEEDHGSSDVIGSTPELLESQEVIVVELVIGQLDGEIRHLIREMRR
jgi:hypothetical protein